MNPYLGSDGVNPFLKVCDEEKKGIFVLVKTSNPSSGELQDRMVKDGPDGEKPLYEIVGGMVAAWAREHMPETGNYSYVGAVVGATYPQQLTELRKQLPHTFFLVPGYGAQGGAAADACRALDENGIGGIINSSRAIMCAYQKAGADEREYARCAREEAIRMRDELNAAR